MTTKTIAALTGMILGNWKPNPHFAAVPALVAMMGLKTMDDAYFGTPAPAIVADFLANAGTWVGATAKAVKAELAAMVTDAGYALLPEIKHHAYVPLKAAPDAGWFGKKKAPK